MFIVVLAQLERQPLKEKKNRRFVNGYVPINEALVFLRGLFCLFPGPSYFYL